jgi:hypothetical protein
VQTNRRWPIALLEVAANGILDGAAQLFPGVGFGEDGMPQGARCIPALRRLLYEEDDFAIRRRLRNKDS